jgi:hypothetical protein
MTKKMSARDEKVTFRNKVLMKIHEGTEALNDGDRTPLSTTLKYINNNDILSVDTSPEGKYEIFNTDYTYMDRIVLVKEGDLELMLIFQIKEGACKGQWRVTELNPDYFLLDADLEAEAQWEQDSETAYERYYDYKASMDDPRGQ